MFGPVILLFVCKNGCLWNVFNSLVNLGGYQGIKKGFHPRKPHVDPMKMWRTNNKVVEHIGIEPTTSSLRTMRSPN